MPKHLIRLEGKPIFDIASYARHGSSRRDRLSPGETEQITLTVRRAPEVMVKVLTRGGQDLKAIRLHLAYLNRGGDLDIETDDGERLRGEGVESELLLEWDLELEEDRRRSRLGPREDRAPPKMVHKLLFSMPPGTPPQKVLEAVKSFAREEFALQQRYALVLHTDEPHPHVHMLVKAMNEQGRRLNIRKATLRHWREGFARHLREVGVPANATERAVRGETKSRKSDGIFRANLRSDSTHMHALAESVARELARGELRVEPGKATLRRTRKDVRLGWEAIEEIIIRQGHPDLAAQVRRFANQMPDPMTEREWWAAQSTHRTRDGPDRSSQTR